MSKGLEALQEMRKYGAVMIPNCEIIEKELKSYEELEEQLPIVNKYIRALEVIKSIEPLFLLVTLDKWLLCDYINKEQHDLLKEVLYGKETS